jgi:hypothetical protein
MLYGAYNGYSLMTTTKLNLTIILPGRVIMSEQECSKNPQENYISHRMVVEDADHTLTPITFQTRKSRPAKQSINICEEAYRYMTAKAIKEEEDRVNCPEWAKPKDWRQLSKTQRLEAHLDRICKSLNGVSFEYHVLED